MRIQKGALGLGLLKSFDIIPHGPRLSPVAPVVFLVHMLMCPHNARITNQFKIFFEEVKPVVFSVMETKQLVDLTITHFQSVVLEPRRNSLSFFIL